MTEAAARCVYPWRPTLRTSRFLANPSRVIRRIVVCCVMVMVPASWPPLMRPASASPASEWEVKGAFVLNFIRFVSWSNVPGEDRQALPVCALANSDFASAVRQAVTGKMVQNRSILFRFDAHPDPSRCRVVVVDGAEYRTALPALKAVGAAPVLTIGNGPGLIDLGGMFELIVEGRKIRFNTNLEAIRQGNLQVSTNLLQLSRNLTVRQERAGQR